ncbi:MAG: DUF1738 domain-containing protein [Acidobacteria bacterium]|nr:DUF1738 domain-containing protein [Acidobacteriota bacterium]
MQGKAKTQVMSAAVDPTGDARDRFEAYEFAGRVAQQLMRGQAPWQKFREPGERVLPRSLRTGQLYTEYNSVYLSTVAEERGFRDVRWGTPEQIEAMGGRIRDGEQGEWLPGRTPTTEPRGLKVEMGGDSLTEVYSDDYSRRALIEARSRAVDPHTVYRVGFVGKDGNTAWSAAGSNKKEADGMVRDYLKSGRIPSDALPGPSYSAVTRVYNAEQAEGLPLPDHSRSAMTWKAHQRAEDILQASGVKVRHVTGDRAWYSQHRDEIAIPEKSRFASATDYYRTAVKQLAHAAAHPSRLGREVSDYLGDPSIPNSAGPREDLRAEMAANLTCERIGLGYSPQATLGPTVKASVLSREPEELVQLAHDSQKISNHLVAGGRARATAREQHSPSPGAIVATRSPKMRSAPPQPRVGNPERLLQRSGGPAR